MFNRSIVIKKAREILVEAYIFKRLIYLNVEKMTSIFGFFDFVLIFLWQEFNN